MKRFGLKHAALLFAATVFTFVMMVEESKAQYHRGRSGFSISIGTGGFGPAGPGFYGGGFGPAYRPGFGPGFGHYGYARPIYAAPVYRVPAYGGYYGRGFYGGSSFYRGGYGRNCGGGGIAIRF